MNEENEAEGAPIGAIDTHPRFRPARPVPLPDTFLSAASALGLDLPPQTEPRFFSFYRRKHGTDVHLRHGKLTINLSAYDLVPPMRFREAREWARRYAEHHSFVFREEPHYSALSSPSRVLARRTAKKALGGLRR